MIDWLLCGRYGKSISIPSPPLWTVINCGPNLLNAVIQSKVRGNRTCIVTKMGKYKGSKFESYDEVIGKCVGISPLLKFDDDDAFKGIRE